MGINATNNESTNNDIDAQPKKEKSQSDDMRDTFLQMIVTQMQNQDPTKPMDNTDLTSQLAQIASLESMNRLNDSVTTISKQINSGQSMQAAQLVGKNVLIPGSDISLVAVKEGVEQHLIEPTNPLHSKTEHLIEPTSPLHGETEQNIADYAMADTDKDDEGDTETTPYDTVEMKKSGYTSTPFGFFLVKPADKIEITIRDRNKGIVRTITIEGETKPDIYDRTWDGRNDKGELVLDTKGKYTFDVKATNKGEELADQELFKLKHAKVNGVTPLPEGPMLDVGIGHSISVNDVIKVYPDY